MSQTLSLVTQLSDAGQDYEWYPTSRRMIDVVAQDITCHASWRAGAEACGSILDIGAGDGRVLTMLAEYFTTAKLYGIEKSTILQQRQPDEIIPVGTEFIEQDLMGIPVDVVFCNPPYSEFEEWVYRIITMAHTHMLYLIIPQRWQTSELITGALKARGVTATVIHEDDFLDADRAARARVHIVRVTMTDADTYHRWDSKRQDPFDIWFDQNIDTFDREVPVSEYESEQRSLARIHQMDTIPEMVAAFQEEYTRMEEHYKAIFKLDAGLLKELGVDKHSVREGLKKRIQGLKHIYWQGLFAKLDVITARLTTKTKNRFLERLTGQTAIAFTISNAYAVVLWAIKAANQYFDSQIVDVFRELSTREGTSNYASNRKTWEHDRWRYNNDAAQHSHYVLDYRIVLHHYAAIFKSGFGSYDYYGNLHKSCHEVIDDVIAVFGNLGFLVKDVPSRTRVWCANDWQNFEDGQGTLVFQVKGFLNGNLHFRFNQHAIKALNIEAGRLLGWLRSPQDVVDELGYDLDEAVQFFGSNQRLGGTSVKLLAA